MHNLIEWDYQTRKGEHRTVTLIFAKERTKPAIRDALFNGRTVVWFKDILIGKEKNLVPLLESMISIESLGYREGTQMDVNQETSILTVSIRNKSSAELKIQNQSAFSFIKHTNLIVLPSEGEMELQVKTLKQLEDIKLDFLVLNALIEPDKNPIINFKINI